MPVFNAGGWGRCECKWGWSLHVRDAVDKLELVDKFLRWHVGEGWWFEGRVKKEESLALDVDDDVNLLYTVKNEKNISLYIYIYKHMWNTDARCTLYSNRMTTLPTERFTVNSILDMINTLETLLTN